MRCGRLSYDHSAKRLNIKLTTVKDHIGKIYTKRDIGRRERPVKDRSYSCSRRRRPASDRTASSTSRIAATTASGRSKGMA
ncbi:hypothetical protein MKFW12EY_38910 [Methylomonas koyamae]|nr:hypothetical protein MKFW12EY_38910 [Methylomonas koyamae]